MSKIAYVQVLGFSDMERHALGSLLRISQQRSPSYALCSPDQDGPRIVLADSEHPASAALAEQSHRDTHTKLIWVGRQPHIFSWRSFERPIAWVKILQAMDEAHSLQHSPVDSDFDFDIDEAEDDFGRTQPTGLATDTAINASAAPYAEPAKPVRPARKRVLVVDDDLMARLYLKAKLALVEPVVDVDEASTGDEAMQMARTFSYDGVLLDINMPGTDGYAVCRAIKRPSPQSPSAANGRIPMVVVVTSRNGMVDRVRGTLAGADAYLPKPPHPARLRDLIEAM